MDNPSKLLPVVAFAASVVCVVVDLVRKRRAAGDPVLEDDVRPPARAMGRRNSISAECGLTPDMMASAPKPVHPKTPEQRVQITRILASNVLFQGLDERHTSEVVDAFYERQFQAGDVVIQQGDSGDEFFVVQEGEYEVEKDGKKVGMIKAGGCFGELALMYRCPRAATIRAVGRGPHITWACDRLTFTSVLMGCFMEQRSRHDGFLKQVKIFDAHMDQFDRLRLADAFTSEQYTQGEQVVRQGDAGDKFFVIEEGEATVLKNGVVVNRLGVGSYFGELAVLNSAPRAATVVAASPRLKVAVLDADAFQRLLPDHVRAALRDAAVAYASGAPQQ